MIEHWEWIDGWKDMYKISDLGRVYSIRSGQFLKAIKCSNGYHAVNLTKHGVREQHVIHRGVLTAFVGECPEGTEGCHGDGDRGNNYLTNLRWDTRKNNHQDKWKHGTYQIGENASHSKLTNKAVLEIRASDKSARELAEIYGVGKTTIFRARHKLTFGHI